MKRYFYQYWCKKNNVWIFDYTDSYEVIIELKNNANVECLSYWCE